MPKTASKQTIARAYILMLISPPVSLLSSLRSMTFNQRRWLLIIAGTIMGATFLFDEIGDGIRHYEIVKTYYSDITFLEFVDVTWKILTLQGSEMIRGDLYIHLISYFSGGILSYPMFFWVIVGFIYSYFYVSSIFKIYELYGVHSTTFLFVLLFSIFICLKSFEGIQFVRTLTGFWVMFYGVLQYHITQKRKYLVLIFLFPPLIHFGFLALALPAWALIFLNTQNRIIKISLVAVFITSFFITIEQAQILEITTATELGEGRTQSYHRADREAQLLQLDRIGGRNFYAAFHDAGLTNAFILGIAFTLILSQSYFTRFTSIESKLFGIGLTSYSLSNFIPFLYAVSNRSAGIALIFLMAAIALYVKRTHLSYDKHKFKSLESKFILFFGVLLSYFFLYRFAVIIQWLSAYFFAFPIIPILFGDANMTVREFLGPVFEPLFN